MKRAFVREYWDHKSVPGLERAVTPDWSAANLERHLALLDLPDELGTVLEIGCGLGRLLFALYDRGAALCVGVDASRAMLAEAGNRLEDRINVSLIHCDGSGAVPVIPDGYFDLVFSIITFQHIPNTATVLLYLAEAHRLLRPGGALRFQVLASDVKPGRELWTYHPHPVLRGHLAALGFQNLEECPAGIWTVFKCRK